MKLTCVVLCREGVLALRPCRQLWGSRVRCWRFCHTHRSGLQGQFISLFLVICYDRVDSSEDPVYGADVSATLTDPDCKVSSSLYFSLLFATTGLTALRIPCTVRTFPPHSQIQTARSDHLFISRFVCYDRVDSSEDPVYGADVSATLTDPDCKVSSSLYFSLFATTGWTARRIPCTERMFPTHSQMQTARSVHLFISRCCLLRPGVDSSEDPVYGADVSATLTDADCKVSSSIYFSLFATIGWTAPRILCTVRTFPPHSQIQTARSVHLFISRCLLRPGGQLRGSRVRCWCFRHTHRSGLQGQIISLFLVLFATTGWTALRIPCTGRMFLPHSQIQTARSVHLFISRFVCYVRVDSFEDPVYGADVSATLTDPDCKVSSRVPDPQ